MPAPVSPKPRRALANGTEKLSRVERTVEVLTRIGMFDDDRVLAFERWLERKLVGVAPGIRRNVESWLGLAGDGDHASPRPPSPPDRRPYATYCLTTSISFVLVTGSGATALDVVSCVPRPGQCCGTAFIGRRSARTRIAHRVARPETRLAHDFSCFDLRCHPGRHE